MGEVIAVISQKGGDGETATAVNLGACLSAIKRRVLLVGIDPQCGLGKCFGISPGDARPGLIDVLRDGTPAGEVIYQVHPRLPRLDVIPANVDSMTEEAEFRDLLDDEFANFSSAIDQLRTSYDFIFIDCPPRLDMPTKAALMVADSYLVPIQCEFASMATVGGTLRGALEVKRMLNQKLAIFGFLLTMADRRARFAITVVREVRQYLKERVFRTIIPRDPRIAEAPHRQAPVITYDLECPGARAYIQLAREILGARIL